MVDSESAVPILLRTGSRAARTGSLMAKRSIGIREIDASRSDRLSRNFCLPGAGV